ncbi:MAG: NAD(P)H-dependent oxidoreductase [Oscillospiraceae bacterium]|nr:NAD(P)H-dependent oxidoreductase [Oscillospiraceae bacterium]
MKILIIHGSMRKGSTYALTAEIMTRLATKPNVEFIEMSVADLVLPFCISCHLCFTKGEEFCPHYCIMKDVQAAFAACDGVILSGTTYMWALNAAMKNLMDHLAYGFHRPEFFGKKGMVIATSAGNGEKNTAKYLKTILGQWGINGAISVTQNFKEQKLKSPKRSAAKLDCQAEQFYQLIASKKPVAPSFRSIAVHNAFRAMSLSDFTGSARDTQFWQQKEFDRVYPTTVGPVKYIFGAMVCSVVKSASLMIGRKVDQNSKS